MKSEKKTAPLESCMYESKYFSKYLVFPREEHCWRMFATQAEANQFKEKHAKDVTSVSPQPGNLWQVYFWKHFNSPEELQKDWEDRIASTPEKRHEISELEQMTDEEVNEKLQKKITTERKSRKKKDDKKKK